MASAFPQKTLEYPAPPPHHIRDLKALIYCGITRNDPLCDR